MHADILIEYINSSPKQVSGYLASFDLGNSVLSPGLAHDSCGDGKPFESIPWIRVLDFSMETRVGEQLLVARHTSRGTFDESSCTCDESLPLLLG